MELIMNMNQAGIGADGMSAQLAFQRPSGGNGQDLFEKELAQFSQLSQLAQPSQSPTESGLSGKSLLQEGKTQLEGPVKETGPKSEVESNLDVDRSAEVLMQAGLNPGWHPPLRVNEAQVLPGSPKSLKPEGMKAEDSKPNLASETGLTAQFPSEVESMGRFPQRSPLKTEARVAGPFLEKELQGRSRELIELSANAKRTQFPSSTGSQIVNGEQLNALNSSHLIRPQGESSKKSTERFSGDVSGVVADQLALGQSGEILEVANSSIPSGENRPDQQRVGRAAAEPAYQTHQHRAHQATGGEFLQLREAIHQLRDGQKPEARAQAGGHAPAEELLVRPSQLKTRQGSSSDDLRTEGAHPFVHDQQPVETPFARSASPLLMDAQTTLGAQQRGRLSTDSAFQIATGVTQFLPKGGGEMKIRLKPDHLGELLVKVTAHGNRVGLQISASNQQAKEVIEESLSGLRDQLQSKNLTMGGVEVSLMGNQATSHGAGNPFGMSDQQGQPQPQAQSQAGMDRGQQFAQGQMTQDQSSREPWSAEARENAGLKRQVSMRAPSLEAMSRTAQSGRINVMA